MMQNRLRIPSIYRNVKFSVRCLCHLDSNLQHIGMLCSGHFSIVLFTRR